MASRRGFLTLVGGAFCAAAPVFAQTTDALRLAVVVLDRDRLFTDSDFGKRVFQDLEVATKALFAENRKIEAALEAEERDLTEARATMATETFRGMVQDFDTRVETIRRAQDSKTRSLSAARDRAQQVFFDAAGPILRQLSAEVGALVILDRRMVLASADQVDITDRALARIDATLGEGPGLDALLEAIQQDEP